MWDLVGNPEDQFSHNEVQIIFGSYDASLSLSKYLKAINSTVAKRGSVFIVLMTPDGAIWSRYQRAVLMM